MKTTRGVTVFMTGLPASGKTTLAGMLTSRLGRVYKRTVTMLDGDEIRCIMSPDLGYSREDRNLHVQRVVHVAAEVTRHGGIAICSLVAPYDNMRKLARTRIEAHGVFVLVHVATPIEECRRRDPKNLYAKAEAGKVKQFTGVSDPYEEPRDANLTLDTSSVIPRKNVDRIVSYLKRRRLLP